MDAKHSKTGKYGLTKEVQRQLEGVRTGLRDGKIDGFYYVTNGIFGERFHEEIDKANLMIARDHFDQQDRLYHDEHRGIDRAYLTQTENEQVPADSVPASSLTENNKEVRGLTSKYGIPQIELCEHVTRP